MNWPEATSVALFLGGTLAIVALWHGRIRAAEDRRLLSELQAAKEQGSDRPIAQHPQVNPYLCLGCSSCVRACIQGSVLAIVHGRACLVRASRCMGCGCCERACPIGALTVSLGDTRSRTDIPVLSDDLETSVPRVFIAGELGGIALIHHAMEQGTQVVHTIHCRLRAEQVRSGGQGPVDVLIVGCGPAGIAAALTARHLKLSYRVIDQSGLGGTVRKYPRNKLTMTQPIELPLVGRLKRTEYTKEELLELWEGLVRRTGIVIDSGISFTDLAPQPGGTFAAQTSDGPVHCHYVILALGRRGTPRRLGVPGEESERVLYQLADAASYSNEALLVVGGGDSAIEAATALAVQPGNRVTMSYRRQAFFRIKPKNEERIGQFMADGRVCVHFNSQVKGIEPGRVAIELQDGEGPRQIGLAANYVFVFAGGDPPYPLLKKIGIRFNGESEPEPDAVAAGARARA